MLTPMYRTHQIIFLQHKHFQFTVTVDKTNTMVTNFEIYLRQNI